MDLNDGAQIRAAREARGWSREELANRAGMSTDGLRRIEGGLHQPHAKSLRALRTALERPMEDRADSEMLARVVRAWPAVPEKMRAVVVSLVETASDFRGGHEASAPALS